MKEEINDGYYYWQPMKNAPTNKFLNEKTIVKVVGDFIFCFGRKEGFSKRYAQIEFGNLGPKVAKIDIQNKGY